VKKIKKFDIIFLQDSIQAKEYGLVSELEQEQHNIFMPEPHQHDEAPVLAPASIPGFWPILEKI
jgi:hypothetical protein